MELSKAQFPMERTSFRKADGTSKTISATVRKTYEGTTDYMPEKWHEKLAIALNHDDITIEGDKYLGGINLEGEYSIEWIDFLDHPTAPAKFSVNVTPFDATNNNCQSCEEATQINLADDTFPGSLAESTSYTMNVMSNDNICCSPATFSISGTYNADYLSAATISQLGVLSITVKADVTTANNVLLLTYRVACPNGGFDEAKVYGNFVGSTDACLAPLNVIISGTTPTSAVLQWTAPSPAPASGYIYDVYLDSAPGVPVLSGTSPGPSVVLEVLTPGTAYTAYLRSDCGASESNNISVGFTTMPQNDACGAYEITYQLQPTSNPPYITINYTDCFGDPAKDYIILPSITKGICALQSANGVPVHIITDYPTRVDIEYLGLC